MQFFILMTARIHREHIKTVMKILDLERLDMIAFEILYTIKTLKPFLKYYIPNPETKKRAFAPYKYEIAMLREGAFHEDLKEKILEGNK